MPYIDFENLVRTYDGNKMSATDTIQRLESTIGVARQTIVDQKKLLDQLTQAPLLVGTVIEISGKYALVSASSGLYEVLAPASGKKIIAGDSVVLSIETSQIIRKAPFGTTGAVVTVKALGHNNHCTVETHEGSTSVNCGQFKVEAGQEVVLDSTHNVIVGKHESTKIEYEVEAETGVTWNDIGGLVDAKKAMIEAIELPFRYPELYRYYGKKPVKGIELFGPPGCGKTMLAKAVVSALRSIHGKEKAQGGFFYVRGPEILNPYVGNSEASIRVLFAKGKKYFKETGIPAVICIDEAESILSKRGSGISSDMEKTIVPMFLAEMDGLEESGVIVLLLTNRADRLDSAVVRPGRIDRRVRVGRPDKKATHDIFKLYLKRVPLKKMGCKAEVHCTARIFDSRYTLYQIHRHSGDTINFGLGDVSSGAMIANIVDRATTACLRQDLQIGRRSVGKGLGIDELDAAMDAVYKEVQEDDHKGDIAAFVVDFREDVKQVTKFTQGSA